jgi:uncharacterized protein (DUF1778 family)
MAKTETENFTIRLTKQDRNYLDSLANLYGMSAGRFITKLLRREVLKLAADIAKKVVTVGTAKEFGIPEKLANTLEKPEDLETVMENDKYIQFFDECYKRLTDEVTKMKTQYEEEEFAE